MSFEVLKLTNELGGEWQGECFPLAFARQRQAARLRKSTQQRTGRKEGDQLGSGRHANGELSADTVASWSARSLARKCRKQPTSPTQRLQRGTNLSCALFTNNADGQILVKDGELPGSTHNCPKAGRPRTYMMTYIEYSIS